MLVRDVRIGCLRGLGWWRAQDAVLAYRSACVKLLCVLSHVQMLCRGQTSLTTAAPAGCCARMQRRRRRRRRWRRQPVRSSVLSVLLCMHMGYGIRPRFAHLGEAALALLHKQAEYNFVEYAEADQSISIPPTKAPRSDAEGAAQRHKRCVGGPRAPDPQTWRASAMRKPKKRLDFLLRRRCPVRASSRPPARRWAAQRRRPCWPTRASVPRSPETPGV